MAAPEDNPGCLAAGLVGIIIVLAIASNSCSKRATPVTDTASESTDLALGNMDGAAEQEAPLPLDRSALQRGAQQMKLVARISSPRAAYIYSQNCYDAVAQRFDWHQLDRCGGFDAMTIRWLELSTDASATEQELAWFQAETTAGRYLSAATAHGQPGTEADLRWAGLEARVSQLPLPQVKAPATAEPMDSITESDETDEADSNMADDPLAPAGE